MQQCFYPVCIFKASCIFVDGIYLSHSFPAERTASAVQIFSISLLQVFHREVHIPHPTESVRPMKVCLPVSQSSSNESAEHSQPGVLRISGGSRSRVAAGTSDSGDFL